MAFTIPQILRQFKADVSQAIAAEAILKICGYLRYVCRDRVLGPVTTVHVFLLQILHGNTACTALSRLAGIPFTAARNSTERRRLLFLSRNVQPGRLSRAKIADNECRAPVSGTQRKTGPLGVRDRDCLSKDGQRVQWSWATF
jgi:hypothetical protein